MNRYVSGVLLMAGLTCMPAAHAAFFDFGKKEEAPPPSPVPVVTVEDSIDSYVAKLVATLKGEQAPLWDQNSDGAFIIRIPGFGKDLNVDVMKHRFESLCIQKGAQAFFVKEMKSAPILRFERSYLEEQGVTPASIEQFGLEVKYLSYYDGTGGVNHPRFKDFNILEVPNFSNQISRIYSRYAEHHGFTYSRDGWDDSSGVCANPGAAVPDIRFSWYFGTLEQTYSAVGDLYLVIRTHDSLQYSMNLYAKRFYTSQLDEIKEQHDYEARLTAEAKEKERQADIAWERQIREEREQKERENREQQKRDLQHQRELKALRSRTAQFQKALKSGDDSNCGLIIETKGAVVYVQTMIGQVWIKKADLYPQGVMGCEFENGHYVPGRLE